MAQAAVMRLLALGCVGVVVVVDTGHGTISGSRLISGAGRGPVRVQASHPGSAILLGLVGLAGLDVHRATGWRD